MFKGCSKHPERQLRQIRVVLLIRQRSASYGHDVLDRAYLAHHIVHGALVGQIHDDGVNDGWSGAETRSSPNT